MSDQTGLYQDGNSVFENVFIQGTLNVATANEKLVVDSDGISIDTITTNSNGKTTFSGDVQIDGDELFIADSIKHVGDIDTLINFPSNDVITFRTDGAERVRIESNGRVGINSSSPAATLDIRDVGSTGPGILISGCTLNEGDLTVQDGEILHVGHFNSDTNTFTERLRVHTDGRVGIGSHGYVPERTLDVIGSIRKTEYEPGEIIETVVGVCDGNDVTVKSGTYTLANVNDEQALTNTHATISGSSIDYAPPAGTTRVCYEFWVYLKDAGSGSNSRPIVHFRSQLRNASDSMTTINNSRHTWRFASQVDQMDVQTWVYNKVIVSIGQVSTESVANGRLVNWDSARTFRWQARRYSASYAGILHETNNWDGTGTDIRVRPHVKITAIA